MRARFLGGRGFSSSDSFDRANGGIDAGNPLWTNVAGDTMPQIVANQIVLVPPVTNRAFISTTPANLKKPFSRLTFISQVGGALGSGGPSVFNSGTHAAQNWYGAIAGWKGVSAQTCFLVKSIGGAQTILAQAANGTLVAGATQEIRAVVSPTQVDLTYLQNGAVLLTATDNLGSRLTTGACGICASNSDGVMTLTFDNFFCGIVGSKNAALYFNIGRGMGR